MHTKSLTVNTDQTALNVVDVIISIGVAEVVALMRTYMGF